MSKLNGARLEKLIRAFGLRGELKACEEIKVGNVNHTYKLDFVSPTGEPQAYIAQEINTYVFKQPEAVMENIDRVTEHMHKNNPDKTMLDFQHSATGQIFAYEEGGEGGFWRVFNYIPSLTVNETDDLEIIHNAGEAFGEFQMMLADFDASRLHETIPYFHDTEKRFEDFAQAVETDAIGRAGELCDEIDYLFAVRDKACALTRLYKNGQLPLRVTHNDTKINNVLFDAETKRAIAVIDLDTVMPGLMGHDFGDAIRFAANRVAEDSPEHARAGVDLEIFRAFAEGFLAETAAVMTEPEVDSLALSCFCLTVELATRFLGDYLLGSPYFKTDYPEHNLVRARTQIALAQDMERRLAEMEQIVREIVHAAREKKSQEI